MGFLFQSFMPLSSSAILWNNHPMSFARSRQKFYGTGIYKTHLYSCTYLPEGFAFNLHDLCCGLCSGIYDRTALLALPPPPPPYANPQSNRKAPVLQFVSVNAEHCFELFANACEIEGPLQIRKCRNEFLGLRERGKKYLI